MDKEAVVELLEMFFLGLRIVLWNLTKLAILCGIVLGLWGLLTLLVSVLGSFGMLILGVTIVFVIVCVFVGANRKYEEHLNREQRGYE